MPPCCLLQVRKTQLESMHDGLAPSRSGSIPHKSETVMDASRDGLMPSEVVHLATLDPAEQVPRVARSVTPPPPMMERGDDTASAACTSIRYRVCYDPPPMNTPVREGETIEGSRTMRNRPYPVLKCARAQQHTGDR